MLKCELCGKEITTIGKHLRYSHKEITAQDYYDKYLKKNETEGVCPVCGKPTYFLGISQGYRKHCSTSCSTLDPNVQKITQKTTLSKYGVKNVLLLTDVQQKAHQNTSSQEALEKRKTTNLKKLGVEFPSQSTKVKNKIKQTCIEKYGVISPAKSELIKDKIKQTCLEKYGVISNWSSDDPTLNGRGTQQIIKQDFIENNNCTPILKIADSFGWSWIRHNSDKLLAEPKLHNYYVSNDLIPDIIAWNSTNMTGTSYFQKDVLKEIKKIYAGSIIEKARQIIKPYEIDIFIPEYNIGIECNGTFWHSTLCKTDKHYHEMKSKLAEAKGIRLIHIYEFEWDDKILKEKILQLLRIALHGTITRIYARNCIVKQITNKEAKPFNNLTHLQGHRNAQVTYGLFYNNELVQLMSFSKTKYNRNLKNNNSWEIIRGCPGSNNIVIGGVQKLFKHFVNDYKPDSVFSYCDFNKFDGKSYLALNMRFVGYTGPNKWWLLNNNQVVVRSPKKYTEYKENAKASIWGAGSKKFLVEFNNN